MLRKPAYLQAEHAQRDRWLVSYTDIVTILLILFVAIAAQSFRQRPQPQRPPAPQAPKPQAQAPAQPKPPVAPPNPALEQARLKLAQKGLDLRLEKRGLVISLPQAILFPPGDDQISASAFPVVSQIADVLNSVPNKIALVGHADSVPIHNQRFRDNWALSSARSLSLLELLSSRYGVDEVRLSMQSYGSNDPKDSNDTEAGRAENRRVEILILDDSAQ
ncbi:MAG TPA: OmpA family protein [Bryobacteraceae bacterium]|nr:OmpA family protein [Bryobacteraceae bacterium]